ncbi:hypothetical protein EV426DRAFT_682033 [Tirmania nivea]|nr:hypothetical protein EV426DRAFT_682033 [Tirmania nivea]
MHNLKDRMTCQAGNPGGFKGQSSPARATYKKQDDAKEKERKKTKPPNMRNRCLPNVQPVCSGVVGSTRPPGASRPTQQWLAPMGPEPALSSVESPIVAYFYIFAFIIVAPPSVRRGGGSGRGAPPRSGIEREIKGLLHKRAHRETAIGWVRSHIGIPGNEKADKRAAYESALGRIAGSQQVATAAGIRAAAKARRKDMRSEPGFGANRCLWHRHALSAYTWLRTNRGPQNYWLHLIRKVDSPACPNCDHPSEDGYHITFDCPHHHQQRQEFIGDARTWEDLDTPIWKKEEGGEARRSLQTRLSRGAPPRSGIEKEIKDLLHRQGNRETAIGWVRSHIGIPGNEKADRRAAYESALGCIAGTQQVATAAGIRAAAKARRKDMRSEPGFGINRSLWHRHAMAAYTWLRITEARRTTGSTSFAKSTLRLAQTATTPRRTALISASTAHTTAEGEEKEWDAVEAYFAYLYRTLAGR